MPSQWSVIRLEWYGTTIATQSYKTGQASPATGRSWGQPAGFHPTQRQLGARRLPGIFPLVSSWPTLRVGSDLGFGPHCRCLASGLEQQQPSASWANNQKTNMEKNIESLCRFLELSASGDVDNAEYMATHYAISRVEDELGMQGVRDGQRMEEWCATLVAAYWRSLRP